LLEPSWKTEGRPPVWETARGTIAALASAASCASSGSTVVYVFSVEFVELWRNIVDTIFVSAPAA
jgi:hypothetical protein